MNASTTATLTEAQKIEEAIDRLVTAAVRYQAEPRIGGERGLVSVGESLRETLDLMHAPPVERAAGALLERPVGTILRQGVRTLAKRLHEIGGLRLMDEVCHRVAASDPAREAHRSGIIDHMFDGIGGWSA